MSCQRTSEIDLLAFLDDSRQPEFAEFRAHYPRCRDCAAEVRAWTELQAALRAGGASSAHPAPEELVRYQRAQDGLAAAERRALDAHLATCAPCRDELRALRSFAPPTRREVPASAAAPARRPDRLAGLRRLLWHPALAYALLAAFVAPTLYRQVVGSAPIVERPAGSPELAAAEERRRVEEGLPAALREAARDTESAASRRVAAAEPRAPESGPARSEAAAARRLEAEDSRALERAPRTERFASVREWEWKTSAKPAPRAAPPPPAPPQRSPEGSAPARFARELGAAIGDDAAEDRLAERSNAPAPAPELALRAGDTPSVPASSARTGLRLSIPTPEPGELVIRIVAPGGGRELRERQVAAAGAVAIEVPPEWLAPGRYRVSVQRLAAGLVTDETRFAFEVEDAD